MLSQKNAHPRDQCIFFQEDGHLYTYNGDMNNPEQHFTSVTTVIHKFFNEFDADLIIEKMMRSYKWPQSKYYGMTKEQIKKQWSDSGAEASALGTAMHEAIEDFFNGTLKEEPVTPEYRQFKDFWNEFKRINPGWEPYRTEWVVYDENKKLAGSIDMVLADAKGNLILLDWKRSKEIKMTNKWQKGCGPCRHLDDCNYNHYKLQLNIYRHILETKYNKKIVAMMNIVCHPNQKVANVISIPIIQPEIDAIWRKLPLATEN